MAQIQDGTVTVTQFDAKVVAAPENDWTQVKLAIDRGSPVYFSLSGATQIPRQVLSVTDPTIALTPVPHWELTLVTPWQDATTTNPEGDDYIIHTDFTNNLGLPIFSPGDSQTAQMMARMVEILDTAYGGVVKLTADLTGSSSATLADVTGISFNLTSGLNYYFDFALIWQSSATGAGPKIGLTFPATTIFAATVRIPSIAADGTDAEFTGPIIASGGSVTATTAKAATTNYIARVTGMILPSADTAPLQLQWAVGGTGTITPKRGTFGRLYLL